MRRAISLVTLSSRAMSSFSAPLRVAVLAPPDHPALAAMPADLDPARVTLSVCADTAALAALAPRAVLWVPPAPCGALLDAWPGIAPGVEWVHAFSAGVDGLAPFFARLSADADAAGAGARAGAGAGGAVAPPPRLSNGRGAFSDSLAEYVVWAMLHHNKRASACLLNQKSRQWDKFVMPVVRGKTVGFVGFGHIAQTCVAPLRALGCRLVALRARAGDAAGEALVDETLYSSGPGGAAAKARLFAEADFVVCTLPATPATARFCDAAAFAAMKPSGVFISLGRGQAVDEAALASALASARIAGAACDVFETEPLPPSSPLWDAPNLLLTAHNADFTDDYFEHGWRVWRANLDAFLAGAAELPTPCDARRGY